MNDVIQKIYDIGIVPVIAIDDADKAVPLAKALVKGGLPAAEVTFRTAAAEEAIKRIVAEVPEMLVGAGTVLTKEQADRAIAAGVKFIVSPGFNPEITKYVIDKGMLMMPGHRYSGRDGAGHEHGPGRCEILPGRTERRRRQAESCGRPLHKPALDAHGRRQRQKPAGLPVL